jgi:protease I
MARVAFVVADGFEDSEFRLPYDAVKEAGHEPILVGEARGDTLTGMRHVERVVVNLSSRDAWASDFDALVIPGGRSPDRLRLDPRMVALAREMLAAGKPVAAVCHGPQLLAAAAVLRGRTLTSWPSIREELEHAGASWVDQEVVEDGNLVTARRPADLPAFCNALVKQLAFREAAHP